MPLALHSALRWFNHHPYWQAATVPVWGARLHAPTFDRWLALRLHQFGWMGVKDRRFFEAHVRPGMRVVDIGANQGLYSLLFAHLVGETGTVWAFEPDTMLYDALVANVTVHNQAPTIRPRNTALGAKSGTMTLHRSLLNSGDNRLASSTATAGPREPVTIHVERLDAALAGEHVDFIKLDVQGWEMEVLKGLEGLLTDPRDSGPTIYFEFWPDGLRAAGCEPLVLLRFLAAHGYRVCRPNAERLPPPIQDHSTLIDSIRPGAYTNLYAYRLAHLSLL